MEYLLAIYGDEKAQEEMQSSPDYEALMGTWFQYDEQLKSAVKVVSGNALQPTAMATTVRGKDGQAMTSDGPFAETKEQLGGYYLIDVKDLDEALEWAAKMPNIPWGGAVEVRPIQVFEQQQ